MAFAKTSKDPFAGIENADRLSPEIKQELLQKAKAGLQKVERGPSMATLVVSDILTFIIVGAGAYLLGLKLLTDYTAALL